MTLLWVEGSGGSVVTCWTWDDKSHQRRLHGYSACHTSNVSGWISLKAGE